MIEVRAALSQHDMETPLSSEELRTLASEIEEFLVDNEMQFSHPDWRYVDGLNALADWLDSTTATTTAKVKREVKRAK